MSGVMWAKNVLNNVLLLLGLVVLTAGVAVGGVLLHEPGWFLGVFGGLLLLLVFGEGAYRVWDEADKRATTAARMEGAASDAQGQPWQASQHGLLGNATHYMDQAADEQIRSAAQPGPPSAQENRSVE